MKGPSLLRRLTRVKIRYLFVLFLAGISLLLSLKFVRERTAGDQVAVLIVNKEEKAPALLDSGFGKISSHSREGRNTTERSLIRFEPFIYNSDVEDFTRDIASQYPCSQSAGVKEGEIQDLMCLPRPNYLPDFKNPCYRDDTGHLICVPYYNLLGFDKCGTTDFHARLVAHPTILENDAPKAKEIYYWCWLRYGVWLKEYRSAVDWNYYINAFRSAAHTIDTRGGGDYQPIVGDGGPIDVWDFRPWPRDPQNKGLTEPKVLTPHHMRHMFRDPKFFVLVRDPVERMFSDYMFVGDGSSAEEFDRDVPFAIDMMTSCLRVNTTRQCFFSDEMYHTLPMRLHISCYSIFLREWLAVFHRKHFFILRIEDYYKDMAGSLQAAFGFLGVETLQSSELEKILSMEKQNANSRKKNIGQMSERTRKLLEDFYAPCNNDLRNLLNDDRFLWQDG